MELFMATAILAFFIAGFSVLLDLVWYPENKKRGVKTEWRIIVAFLLWVLSTSCLFFLS